MELNNKIEAFEMPNAEVILFDNEDIITISNFKPGPNEGDFVPADL